jgi:hypothetical protein
VFGTTPQAVTDAVRRYQGKGRGRSLARAAAYREAAAERRKPDLFVWADVATLARWMDVALEGDWRQREAQVREAARGQHKAAPEARRRAETEKLLEQARRQHRAEHASWYLFRTLFNPGGMRYVSTSWEIHEGHFAWRLDLRMRPGQSAPVLALLDEQPLDDELLRGVPRDSYLVLALPAGDGAALFRKAVALADDCHREAAGDGPKPGDLVKKLEGRLRLSLARDVLAGVRGLAWALRLGPAGAEGTALGPEHVGPGVLLALARDEAAARDLESVLPKLLAPGKAPRVVAVAGQRVHSLNGDAAATEADVPAYYGRRGRVVIAGWRRRDVAQAQADFEAPTDLRDHPNSLPALRRGGPVSLRALASGRQGLASLARILSRAPDQTDKDLRGLQSVREASAPMALMPPTLLAVHRPPDGLSAELCQADLRVAAGTVIDLFLAWALEP